MTELKLSTLALMLGLALGALQLYGLLRPEAFTRAARRFPRSLGWGYLLVGVGTVWFLLNVRAEPLADFAAYKKYMLLAFAAIGLLTCVFVRDFLAVRGLAVLFLLLAKLMVDTARWEDTPWRLVIVVWAYLLVIGGMWLTVSPWRLRDFLEWHTATPARLKFGCALRLGFALLVVVLSLTAFRAAEERMKARNAWVAPPAGAAHAPSALS